MPNKKFLESHPNYYEDYLKNYQKNWLQKLKNDPEKYKEYKDKNNARKKELYAKKGLYYKQETARRKKRYSVIREKIRKIIEENGKCALCGFSDKRALEIHHVNGNEDKNNHYKTMNNIIYHKVEYKIICANCHAIIHDARNGNHKIIKT